jgi:hypothetical protein
LAGEETTTTKLPRSFKYKILVRTIIMITKALSYQRRYVLGK